MLRKVVRIDEARCDGCGECLGACAEGAIALVGGKARLVSDAYCDGLGACLGDCPRDAITVEERDADAFDEAAVQVHLERLGRLTAPGGCPGSAPRELPRRGLAVLADGPEPATAPAPRQGGSALGHWPVQLSLVPAGAPWLDGADLLVAADCVPFAYASFHDDFLRGRRVLVGCPKLDDNQAYVAKLSDLIGRNQVRSLTVIRMEVPCCGGLSWAARQGLARSGKQVPLRDVVIGIDGAQRQG